MKFKKIIRNSLKTLIILFVAVFAYFVYLAIWTNYRRKGLTDTIAEFSGITMQCISSLLFSRQRQSAPTTAVYPVDSINPSGEALLIQSTTPIGAEKHRRLSRQPESGRRSPVDSVDGTNPAGLALSPQGTGKIGTDS